MQANEQRDIRSPANVADATLNRIAWLVLLTCKEYMKTCGSHVEYLVQILNAQRQEHDVSKKQSPRILF